MKIVYENLDQLLKIKNTYYTESDDSPIPYTGTAYEVKIDYDDNTDEPLYKEIYLDKDEALDDFNDQSSLFKDFQGKNLEHYVYIDQVQIKNGEIVDSTNIKYVSLGTKEQTAISLEQQIQDWLKTSYNRKYGFYSSIKLGTDINDETQYLQIRIKDHSQNPSNVSKYTSADAYLSIVIANDNATLNRWHSENELIFSGDTDINDAKDIIKEYIQDIIFNLKITNLSEDLTDDYEPY